MNEQRTEGWHKDRLGRVTASRVKAVMMKKETAGRQNLMAELICERLTGEPQDDVFVNAAMQWGIDHEEAAFNAYEALTGEVALRSGFLTLPA